jgi:hypothetical protein
MSLKTEAARARREIESALEDLASDLRTYACEDILPGITDDDVDADEDLNGLAAELDTIRHDALRQFDAVVGRVLSKYAGRTP